MVTRDSSIDIAKGMMIVMLVLHHLVYYSLRLLSVQNDVLDVMSFAQKPIALCYFMQAFFLITGMCSSFNGGFQEFLHKQVRALLIPGLMFSLGYHLYEFRGTDLLPFCKTYLKSGGTYWFLTAMFFGKIAYYWVRRLIPSKGAVIGVMLALSFAGAFLANEKVFPNYYCHWQIFDLMLYVALGDVFKDDIRRDRCGVVALLLYCVFVVIGCFIWGCRGLPYVTYGFGSTIDGWLMHVLMAVSGSVTVLWIARRLPHSTWLCYLGRQSLIVYMTQRASLLFLLSAFATVLNNGNWSTSVIAICVITIATCSIAAVIAYLIEATPLRGIMGRSLKRKV